MVCPRLARALSPLLALTLLATLGAGPARAQTLTGRVLLPGGAPAAGVLLLALSATSDSVVRQAATDADGGFTLAVPPHPIRLRALRIGHMPTELGEYSLRPGERRVVTLRLIGAPIQLRPQVIAAARQCVATADAGEAVVTLLEEVRKALTLSTMRQSQGDLSMRVLRYSALTAPDGRSLGTRNLTVRAGASSRPFQSLPPELLSQVGYVSEDRGGTVYRAPDARLFLSPEFEAGYCLRVEDEADSPLIGLAFSPMGDADIVRIRGTLWVDRTSLELRRLDYLYDGVRRALAGARLGGSVSFTRLPSGIWFEDDWEIRMPRTSILQQVGLSGRMTETEVLDAIQADHGKVLSVSLENELIYATASPVQDSVGSRVISDLAAARPGVRADSLLEMASCAAGMEGASASIMGAVRRRPSTAVSNATVSAEWKERFRVTGFHQWSWTQRTLRTTSATDGFYSVCGVPTDRLIEVAATYQEHRTRTIAVRAPASDIDLWFARNEIPETSERSTLLRVSTADGEPIPFAVVSVGGGKPRIADEEGRVALDVDPASTPQISVRRLGYRPFYGMMPRDSGGAVAVVLDVAPSTLDAVRVTAASSPLERVGFYERMLMAQRGAYSAEFITPEEIREKAASQTSHLLTGSVYVTIGMSAEDGRRRAMALGRNDCRMNIILDGQRINPENGALEGFVAIDDLVSGRTIAAIEIYASNANAPADLVPLTGGGSCGIVAIWTGAP